MMKTIAVIPAYEEAATIADVVNRALAQLDQVIVVDDASRDATSAILADMPVTLIRNEHNRGKGGSLWRGMQAALEMGADAVITLDGDGQHRPEDIPLLLEAAQQYPGEIIIACRDMDAGHVPADRRISNRIANFWISWAAGYAIRDSQSGFRLYPASLLRRMDIDVSRSRSFVFESEILIEAAAQGVHSSPVMVPAIYAKGRRPSHFHPVMDIVRITRMVAWRLISKGLAPVSLLRSLGIISGRM
jgi:glycosyltransferase involved in cell wall biosynthesis